MDRVIPQNEQRAAKRIFETDRNRVTTYDTNFEQVGMRSAKLGNSIFVTSGGDRNTRTPRSEIYILNRMAISNTATIQQGPDFQLVPKPASTLVSLDISDWKGSAKSVDIINNVGQTLKSMLVSGIKEQIEISVSGFPKGVYQVVVKGDQRAKSSSLIID